MPLSRCALLEVCLDIVGTLYDCVLDGRLPGEELLTIDRPSRYRVTRARCSDELKRIADSNRVTTGNGCIV